MTFGIRNWNLKNSHKTLFYQKVIVSISDQCIINFLLLTNQMTGSTGSPTANQKAGSAGSIVTPLQAHITSHTTSLALAFFCSYSIFLGWSQG